MTEDIIKEYIEKALEDIVENEKLLKEALGNLEK